MFKRACLLVGARVIRGFQCLVLFPSVFWNEMEEVAHLHSIKVPLVVARSRAQ